MKDRDKKIIYVGKAKDLKKRVGSYFSKRNDVKTEILIKKVHSIEPIITGTEYEALLLENTLIKEHQPHYNINLKDGKTYPVIRITNEEYPRVFRTRRFVQDGSLYFGPYPDIGSIDRYLELIEKLFPLRKCKGKLKNRESPCLYYHIGRCAAPCAGKISREEYVDHVEKVKKLLSGETDEIIGELKESMEEASKQQEYERAARYRDLIESIITVTSKQYVVDFNLEKRDYIGFAVKDHLCTFSVFQMRGGKLIGRDVFRTELHGGEEEALTQFIQQYYSDVHSPPTQIYVQVPIDRGPLHEFFRDKLGINAEIAVATEGLHKSIMNMVTENSFQDLEKRAHQKQIEKTLRILKQELSLPRLPRRIEGFDISQLSGKYPVASMVSFVDARPEKKNYRHFHMKSLNGAIDDYEAMREVVASRYTRVINEKLPKPDLILIDGGRGQVRAAYEILETLAMHDIPVFGLAKQNEELFPVEGEPVRLAPGTEALRLLQHVRDESHRFATGFNKQLRQKDVSFSRLEQIKGIGRERSRKLLKEFGTIANIVQSTPAEIASRCKIPEELAGEVLTFLASDPAPSKK
jgi:excinuclease ABC subunit C